MKTLLCLLAAAALLCGCSPKPDPRIAKYETRIAMLESNVTDLYERNTFRRMDITNLFEIQSNLLSALSVYYETNILLTPKLFDLWRVENERITRLENSIANLVPAKSKFAAKSLAVPDQNMASMINARAVQLFPSDKSKQSAFVQQQTEAWYQLHQ